MVCVLYEWRKNEMGAEKCKRCERFCFKNFTRIGGTEYLRTYLQAEKGLTESEFEDAIICSACRTFIYNHVFWPERVKARGSKRALPDSEGAATAAAAVAAKKLKENDKYHTGKYTCILFIPPSGDHAQKVVYPSSDQLPPSVGVVTLFPRWQFYPNPTHNFEF